MKSLLRLCAAAVLTACVTEPSLAQSRTYTWDCVGQVKPKRGDTLIVQRDSSRADTSAVCSRKKPSVPVVVTPLPIPPVAPPVGTGEPVYDPARHTLVFSDNMDRYTSLAAVAAATGPKFVAGQDPRSELKVTPGRSGMALRIAYQGGSQTGAEFYTTGTPSTLDTATHVFTYYARATFPVSTVHPLTNTTLGVKWLMAWHRSGNDRIQWHMHWNPPSSTCAFSKSGVPFTFWQVMDQSRFAGCQGMQPVGPLIEQVADGKWHRFTHEYRPHSRAGSRDGFARMWIDGVKITDVSASACGVVPPNPIRAGMPWCDLATLDHLAVNDGIAFLKIGGAQTTSTPPWTMDVDDIVWWRR